MDLFVVPTIGFDLLYALIIVRLDRRQLVWINVTQHPTTDWIARRLTEAFPWDGALGCLIRTPIARHGHPRQAHRTSVTLAERLCRTVDRINQARVCGPYRGLGRGAFAPGLASLCSLLQQHQNPPVTR
jgi:hypothetical protein